MGKFWDMFLREVKRQNKNGSQVSYLQLVHNAWDPTAQTSRTKILHNFGRTDRVDPAAIERLILSLQRLLDPASTLTTAGSTTAGSTSAGVGEVVPDGQTRSRAQASAVPGSPWEIHTRALIAETGRTSGEKSPT